MDKSKEDQNRSEKLGFNQAIWSPNHTLRFGSPGTEKSAGVLLGLKEPEKLPSLAVDKKSRFNHTH